MPSCRRSGTFRAGQEVSMREQGEEHKMSWSKTANLARAVSAATHLNASKHIGNGCAIRIVAVRLRPGRDTSAVYNTRLKRRFRAPCTYRQLFDRDCFRQFGEQSFPPVWRPNTDRVSQADFIASHLD